MPKRILHMLNSMGMGGIENFIMNVYRQINREEYQFDFVLQCEEESFFEKEIQELGGRIYRIPRFEKHPIKHCMQLKNILKKEHYLAFHRHTAHCVAFIDLHVAKKCKISRRISHSHSSSNQKFLLNYLCRPFLFHYATSHLACGEDAGHWLYGNRPFQVIRNGVDTNKFLFSSRVREEYRKELNIEKFTILGHVGRFSEVKNHRFMIEVFKNLYQKDSSYKLLFCGGGELEEEIKQLCKENQIENAVIFAGIRSDVDKLIQAMDIFLFPSLYEGVPLTLIETQLNGIPCLISNKVPKETIYNNNVKTLPIHQEDIDKWVSQISKIKDGMLNRCEINEALVHDYDISIITNELIRIYEGR